MSTDRFEAHDYYLMDELLTEEQKLIREAARAWVKKEVSPIIEDCFETCKFPEHLLPGLGEIGAFGPYIPVEYGGAGLDQISYGLLMQELEASGVWEILDISNPRLYLPRNAEFGDDIKVVFAFCRVC